MKKNCCADMNEILQSPKGSIRYLPQFREYILESPGDSLICLSLNYCPWCGTCLPPSLRDTFFDILEKEYNLDLDILTLDKAPAEFQSDSWWKKRNI